MQIMVIIHSDKTIVCSMQIQTKILGIPHPIRSHKNKILMIQLNQIQIFPVIDMEIPLFNIHTSYNCSTQMSNRH